MRLLIGLIICSALTVHAAVPNTFSNGTVADANQVNENFTNLDSRISSLESLPGVPYSISYSYLTPTIGSVVTIGGSDYRIIRAPFVDLATGDHYAITYPIPVSPSLLESLTTDHIDGNIDQLTSISGFPATIKSFSVELQSHIGNGEVTYDFSTDSSTGERNIAINKKFVTVVAIQVNQTLLRMEFRVDNETLFSAADNANNYDYVDMINWSSVTDFTSAFLALDTFVDYINIEKLN